MKRPSSQINAPALLVGLIALVSLGSVATASAGSMVTCPERAPMLREERDGESVARLILSLTDAAKRLHGQNHATAAPQPMEHATPAIPTIAYTPPPSLRLPNEQVLGSARLIDLPPPAR